MSGIRYPIRAASRLTGLGIDTLRAWERRYQAVAPGRDDRGRLYTEADIARLRLLRSAVENGHGIGRVAGLDDEALARLAATPVSGAATTPAAALHSTVDTAALDAALRRLDAAAIDHQIGRLALALRPIEFVQQVLMPLLVRVGDDWHHGRGGVAHEHLMVASIRNILGAFLRMHTRADATTRLVLATPSGDRHEIGTLGAAMLAASSGLGVIYLGPDLPARDIVDGIAAAGAQVLVLGVTAGPAIRPIEQELRTIVRELPAEVELWIGGGDAVRHAAIVRGRGLVLPDYDAYQRELVRLGGRVA